MKKIKVVIVSVLAGSGHNSAADLMAQLLGKDERFAVVRYTNPTKFLDNSYNLITKLIPGFHNLFIHHPPVITSDVMTLGQIGFVSDAIQVIKQEQPDIILSTYFLMTHAFKIAEWITGKYPVNVFTYLDYGKPLAGMIPYNIFIRPEYSIVYDAEAVSDLQDEARLDPRYMIMGGHTCRDEFKQVTVKYASKEAARVELLKVYSGKPYQQIGINKTSILIAGGGGGIIQKSFKLLKAIAARQKDDITLLDKYQFFVICGENQRYFKKIMKVRSTKLSWQNIFPFGWLDARKYALLQRAADFPVTFGIAPATMHELLETQCGPLLMHRVRGDHEFENVKYVIRNKLGRFEPETKKVVDLIFKPLTLAKKENFNQRAAGLLQDELQRFSALPDKLVETLQGRLPHAETIYRVSFFQRFLSALLVIFTQLFYYVTIAIVWLQKLLKKIRRRLGRIRRKLSPPGANAQQAK